MRKSSILNATLVLALCAPQVKATSTQTAPEKSVSAVPMMSESEKEGFEKEVNAEIQEWEGKVKELRADVKKTHGFDKHHRHLKRAARHLESDIKDVKHQLAKFKGASTKDLKHYEDHIKAELEDMKVTYNKVASE